MSNLDYYNVLPHRVTLLQGNYSNNRQSISGFVRHHTAGVIRSPEKLNELWDPRTGRKASTNYMFGIDGLVSQHVWDAHTAWANAHDWANRNLLSGEHTNNYGDPAWSISDETIIAGARWVAALANFYKWGEPKFNKNVFDHCQFTSTGCPYHLTYPAGKYNDEWFEEAVFFYHELKNKRVDRFGNPIKHNFPAPKPLLEGPLMALTHEEQVELLVKTREIHNALLAPVPSLVEGSDVKLSRVHMVDQLDRKVEEIHIKQTGENTAIQIQMDANLKIEKDHKLEDETH